MIEKIKNLFKRKYDELSQKNELPKDLIEILLDESNAEFVKENQHHPNYIIGYIDDFFFEKEGLCMEIYNDNKQFREINIGYDDRFTIVIHPTWIILSVKYEMITQIRHRYSHNEELIWSEDQEL